MKPTSPILFMIFLLAVQIPRAQGVAAPTSDRLARRSKKTKVLPPQATEETDKQALKMAEAERAATDRLLEEERKKVAEINSDKTTSQAEKAAATRMIQATYLKRRNAARLKIRSEFRKQLLTPAKEKSR